MWSCKSFDFSYIFYNVNSVCCLLFFYLCVYTLTTHACNGIQNGYITHSSWLILFIVVCGLAQLLLIGNTEILLFGLHEKNPPFKIGWLEILQNQYLSSNSLSEGVWTTVLLLDCIGNIWGSLYQILGRKPKYQTLNLPVHSQMFEPKLYSFWSW